MGADSDSRLVVGSEERDAAYRRLVGGRADYDLGILTAISVGVFAVAGLLPVLGAGPSAPLVAGAGVAILWAAASIRSLGRRRQRREDIALLARADDPRMIAPLLEDLAFYRSRYEGDDAALLLRMLPQVRPDDSLFRHRWYQEALHHALRESGDPKVLDAVLQAMGRVGDGRGIGYVRILAENAGHFMQDEQVSRVAREVLPVLRTRLGLTPPPPPMPNLLRPAMALGSEPQNLLRHATRLGD